MSSAAIQEPLALLLQRLARDGEPAAAAYESLRRRLVVFFRLYEPVEAEELCDSTLDRMAQKLAEGIEIDSVPAYALAIARYVLMEARGRAARHAVHLQDIAEALHPPPDETPDEDDAAALAALRACLAQLGDTARALILDYYASGSGGERIRARAALATRLGTGLNALRNRALRARVALEACMDGRLARRDGIAARNTER